jgi:hypothetical protein
MIAMFRNSTARPACLLALVALGGAACSDVAATTAPTTRRAAVVNAPLAQLSTAGRAQRRAPYISALELGSVYVSINTGSTPFTVTVTNPSAKEYGSIFLKGELQSQRNQPPSPATAFVAYCPYPNGVVSAGDCTMSGAISGEPTLELGPGTYTLKVVQRQLNGTMKVLDSKTVDVIFVKTIEL